jgi:hypothetical protein
MPRKAASAVASAASPEVTTTIRMPNAPAAVPAAETEKPFFWERVAALPIEKFEKEIEIWIYRLEPKVRMAPGERGYLDIVTQPISPSYIKKRWGGGRYRIMVLQNSKILYSTEEEIEGDPIYDKRRELAPDGGAAVGGNGNFSKDEWAREFIGLLREELGRRADQGTPAGTDQVVAMMTSAADKAMDMITKQTPKADAGSQLNELLAAAEKIANLRAPASNGLGELGTIIVPILKALAEKLLTPPDPLAELTKLGSLFDVLEKLRGGAGAGGGEPKDWKAQAVSFIPQILETFKQSNDANAAAAQARANEATMRARAAENLRLAQAPAAAQPAAAPAVPVGAPTFPAAAPRPVQPISVSGLNVVSRDAAPAVPAAVAMAAPDQPVELSQEEFDQMLKVNVVNLFRSGASGGSIASYIEDLKPEFAKDFVRYTAQQVTLFFSADPILKLIVEDPRWNEVLEDAREYMKDENAELAPAAN